MFNLNCSICSEPMFIRCSDFYSEDERETCKNCGDHQLVRFDFNDDCEYIAYTVSAYEELSDLLEGMFDYPPDEEELAKLAPTWQDIDTATNWLKTKEKGDSSDPPPEWFNLLY